MSAQDAPAGDVTLMFTDIEGSTRSWDKYPERFHNALALHNSLIRKALAAHSGYEVKTIGDAFMVAFADPLAAARGAIAIQRAIESADFGDIPPQRVRIGLHSGEIEPYGGDYFGPVVNRTARIADAGQGGMILLSEELTARIRPDLPPDALVNDLGLHRLKDLGAPQRLFHLTHPDLPQRAYNALRTLNALPHNFPAQLTSFVGRQREVAELNEIIRRDGSRLITLIGSGGTGKTRLAMNVAADNLQHYKDGVWLVELTSILSASEVPSAIALALQIPVSPGTEADLRAQITAYLRDRRILLVLDNFEHVIEGARFVSALLRDCPQIACLVTSRQLLQIAGEREYPVEPMELPPADVSVANCLNYESMRLFVERGQVARPDFLLSIETVPAIANICRRLDGIPLAVELTATLMRGMTPQQILPRLRDRFRLLATQRRDLEPRQRSLRGAIDWSYELLTEDERILFAELSVFVGGFVLEDVEGVCSSLDALTLVFDLRDKSLLKANEVLGETRYSMLETLREYALEKMERDGDLPALKDKHAAYFLQKAETYAEQIMGGEASETMQAVTTDLDNLRAGMDWAVQQDDTSQIADYGRALFRFYKKRGLYSESNARLLCAEDACRRSDDQVSLAKILLQRGLILFDQSFIGAARHLFQESYDISKTLDDRPRLVPALNNLGLCAWGESDFREARRLWTEALELARETGQTNYESMLIGNVALIASDQGDFEAAQRYYDESMALHRREKDQEGMAFVLMNSGDMLRRQKRFDESLARLEEGRKLFEALGDTHNHALSCVRIGSTLIEAGRIEEAEPHVATGLQLAREIGDSWSEMAGLNAQGCILGAHGDIEAALARFRRAFELAGKIEGKQHAAVILQYAGVTLEQNGRLREAYIALFVAHREFVALELHDALAAGARLANLRSGLGDEAATLDETLAGLTPADALALR